MKPKFKLLLLFCIITLSVHAQEERPYLLNLGDPAPQLRVGNWLKGEPFKSFEKGRTYVIEFWATWCKPCNAAMPHLSALARNYKDKVTVLAIDVYEKKSLSRTLLQTFVDKKGDQMDFNVAAEDTSFTVHDWIDTWNERSSGIPRTFVVNAQGKVAWIGSPQDLEEVLPKILNGSWDIKKALIKRKADRDLQALDTEAGYQLARFEGDYYKTEDLGKPDSALLVINDLVSKHPEMKYAPNMVLLTFPALLKTNLHKAYEFGKKAIVTPTYEQPAYYSIIVSIDEYYLKIKMPPEIFRLGADACREQIERSPYPELLDMPKLYHKMATWYWLGGDKSKAIKAEQKAIKLSESNVNETKLMPSELALLKMAKE